MKKKLLEETENLIISSNEELIRARIALRNGNKDKAKSHLEKAQGNLLIALGMIDA